MNKFEKLQPFGNGTLSLKSAITLNLVIYLCFSSSAEQNFVSKAWMEHQTRVMVDQMADHVLFVETLLI
jgi:hypothetical protein